MCLAHVAYGMRACVHEAHIHAHVHAVKRECVSYASAPARVIAEFADVKF